MALDDMDVEMIPGGCKLALEALFYKTTDT